MGLCPEKPVESEGLEVGSGGKTAHFDNSHSIFYSPKGRPLARYYGVPGIEQCCDKHCNYLILISF